MLTLRIALVCLGFAAAGTFAATLCGNIAGSTDGQITLVQRQGNLVVRLDSTRMTNGQFCFEHIERRPPGFYGVRIESIPADLQLILDRQDVFLQSHISLLQDSLIFSDDQNNAYQKLLQREKMRRNRLFLAQQLQNLYTGDTSARAFILSLQHEMARLKQEQRQSFTALADEMTGTLLGDYLRMSHVPRLADHPEYHIHYADEQTFLQEHFLDNIDFSCEWLLSTPLLAERTEQLLMIGEASGNRERVVDHLLSRAMANDAIFRYTLDQVLVFYESRQNEEMILMLTERYLDGECTSKELQLEWGEKQEILKHLQPGKPAPALILKERNGETIDLHAIQADRVVLYFWTSWCVHCHTAIESLQRLYQAASGKDVEFVSVSLDEKEDEWRSALDENPMPWIHLRDPESWGSDSARRFYVTATPRYFVLGADKTIIAKPNTLEEIAHHLGLAGLLSPLQQ